MPYNESMGLTPAQQHERNLFKQQQEESFQRYLYQLGHRQGLHNDLLISETGYEHTTPTVTISYE